MEGQYTNMETLAAKIEKIITDLFPASFVSVRYSTNICNSICIRFAFEPKEQWKGGYFENSNYLVSHIWNVSQGGQVLQKAETGLFAYEKSSGRIQTRNKSKANEEQMLKHIAKQFENVKLLIQNTQP